MVPTGRRRAAAGRENARRLLCAVALALTTITVAAAPEAPVIAVSETEGVYRVRATFDIRQAPADAIAVLMDFERIPSYVPDIKVSVVRERTSEATVVEQEAIAKFMMFSKRVHLLLQVRESEGTITFRDECGTSFAVYDGSWAVKPASGGAAITYQLNAKPSFEVPGFVLKRLLKRDAADLIDRIKAEIATRANRGQ